MNKHQIVGLIWRDRETGDLMDVYAKSERRGWFNYRLIEYGQLGMVRKQELLEFCERVGDSDE